MATPDTIEWVVATEGRDAAASLLRRLIDASALLSEQELLRGRSRDLAKARLVRRFREGWDAGPARRGLEAVQGNELAQLGWVSRVHELVEPDSLAE
jgi:hypothetical protein